MTIYMNITGIDGDVTARGHERWIALQLIKFNVKRSLSAEPGRIIDREGTRPSISEVIVTKKMDQSSPLLFNEACVGKAKPQVKIDICQTNDKLSPYCEIVMDNAIVSGYDLLADEKADSRYPEERLTLSFDKLEVRYTPYDSQNNPQSPIPAAYDLREAVAQ